MTKAFMAGVMIFIEQFRARWPWYIGILVFWLLVSAEASLCREQPYSDHSWKYLPQPGTKRRGEGILRMEDAGTSEEDDTDSQDSNIPTDHGHLDQNCWNKMNVLTKLYGKNIWEKKVLIIFGTIEGARQTKIKCTGTPHVLSRI